MRNLKLLNLTRAKLNSAENNVVQFSSDGINENIYIVTKDNTLYGVNIKTNKETFSIPLETDSLLPPNSVVTGIKYIPDLDSVCICTLDGEILLYKISTEEAEVLGCLDSGILSMSWSPDFELVIFATKNLTLKEMTIDWDEVTEVPIHPDFTEEENERYSKELLNNKATVEVSWRGDGKVFACNIPKPDTNDKNESILRVFDRECIYESTCEIENVKGMERSNISWKPSGSLIACTQRLPQNRYDVIFFERNGLRHGEFTIPDNCQVKSIQWNSSSDVLALFTLSLVDKSTAVQLWHVNNYHWYLKQELKFGKEGESNSIANFEWDVEESLKLRIVTIDGDIYQLNYIWECDVTSELSSENQCLITVIDGKSLLCTPMRRLVPPPPMAASTCFLTSPANQIIYSSEKGSHDFLVKYSSNEIAWFSTPELPELIPAIRKRGQKGLVGVGEVPIFDTPPCFNIAFKSNDINLSDLTQITWIDSQSLLAFDFQIDRVSEKQVDSLVELELDVGEGIIKLRNRIPLPHLPIRLYHNKTTNLILIALNNGKVLKYSKNSLSDYFQLPSTCTTIATVTFKANNDEKGEEVLVALNTKLNRLYVKGFECSRECNSIGIHERFLIFSTFNHTLRFIDLCNSFSEDILETSLSHLHDTTQREVERGARIVYVIPFDSKLILQMPRGNLEIIYPRALMLAYCRQLLTQHKYGEAFSQMIRHRIDLNLLYDHNPDDFIDHVKDFVYQIETQNYLNLFLSSIIESDVTKTLFASREQHKKAALLPTYLLTQDHSGKINRICTSIRNVLTESKELEEKYLLTILTSYVQDSPPQLGEALLIIKNLLHKEISTEGTTTKAESALEYVIFLVDVNKLYNVALSMYDLELAVMVAQKSSKDPKEFLPFLSKLNSMEEYFRKYSIDILLENWLSALENISQSDNDDDFKKAVELIKSKSLYREAIRLYESKDQTKFFNVLKIFAEWLEEGRNFEEAGQIYCRCKMDKEAFDCYKKANNWKRLFTLAHSLKFSDEQLKELGYEISTTCYNLSLFRDSALILLEYCGDFEKAIYSFIKGSQWTEAYRLCLKNSREEIIEQRLKPALFETYQSVLGIVQDKKATFTKQVNRLKVVKRTKILFPHTVQLPNNLANNQQGNVFSDTSSFSSTMSSFSYVSVSTGGTRRRKKQKRKRLTGKEGNPHEEEFLVQSLKQLIPSDVDQDEIKNLIVGLVESNFFKEASTLQEEYSAFHSLVKSSLDILLAPLVYLGGEDDEDDISHQKRIEEKNRMDMLYKARDWPLQSL